MVTAHGVQFFVDPAYLARRAAAFLAPALKGGGTAIIVARSSTIADITEQLAGQGVVTAAVAGRLVVLDAEELLDQLLVDGMPDRARFRDHVGALVERLAGRGELRAYGEMVDILWGRGASDALLALETLWGELLRERSFSLLCGYQLRGLADQHHSTVLREICKHHDAVDPEQYLAELEQRALALELEVAHRRQLEQRLEQLLAVTGELAAAKTREQIAQIAIDQGLAAVGAAYGGLWLLDASARSLCMVRVSDLPRGDAERWRTVPIDTAAPLPQVVRDGVPIFIESLAEYAGRYPDSIQRITETVDAPELAYAMLPLAGEGRPFGVLAMTFHDARALGHADRTFLTLLARQCALAIERVRLLDEEREAHREARDATRSRDEIMSVVSHDLRNPLGTILMGASSLMTATDPADKRTQRIRTIAERIHRQAERMGRLMGDLVDFAGIQAGRLVLERGAHAPGAIIEAARELFAPLAEERGLVFDADAAPDLPAIECDPDRAVQVISNLVTTALKVTPVGGRIAIGVEPRDDEIVFFVRDSGPGLDPDELPSIFLRSWQPKQPGYRGASLGLTIARGIVDAHGGRIWAASEPGRGSTFYFSFASNRNN